jgi:tripartite-type tricarboxylate transporter receptor subunit TctC
LAVATGLLATALPAAAQTYPSRSINLIVGYSPGGQADLIARTVAKRLEETFKVPVVVENRPGAGGMIAAQSVAKAAPDGYTLVLVTDAMMTIDAHLQGANKFDINASLDPLINMIFAPLFVAVHKDVPADSVKGLAEFGKQKPQALSFGTSGASTPHRLAGEILQKRGGFTMLHVPYKGTAASVADVVGGQIPVVVGAATALQPHAETGKIKILGVTSRERFPSMPNVPAIAETFDGFNVVSYMGLMVPKGTPADIVGLLNKEINGIVNDPAMKGWMEKQGMIPAGGAPADFRRQIDADFQARGEIIRDIGLKSE